MNIEQQVTSLELSKRLKEIGVKQESYFTYALDGMACGYDCPDEVHNDPRHYYTLMSVEHAHNNNCVFSPSISAFTVAELGEMLPDKIKDDDGNEFFFFHDKFNKCHRISYVEQCDELCSPWIEVKGETEANARAKMLIYLIEQGYVKAEDL